MSVGDRRIDGELRAGRLLRREDAAIEDREAKRIAIVPGGRAEVDEVEFFCLRRRGSAVKSR